MIFENAYWSETPSSMPKYKLRIANVEVATFDGMRKVQALAVVTNPDLSTSLVEAEVEMPAALLKKDSQSLEYFWSDAVNPAREYGVKQEKLEAIARLLPDKQESQFIGDYQRKSQ